MTQLQAVQIEAGHPDVPALLERMRDGDREAAATFLSSYGARIRRRIRGKLSPAMRRLFDSQEILSTVGRRLDIYVRDRRIAAGTPGELWSLITKMADHALVDKARAFRRIEELRAEDGEVARALTDRLDRAERRRPDGAAFELARVIESLPDPADREIIALWLAGTEMADIGAMMSLHPGTVRRRWQQILDRLRRDLGRNAA